MAQDRANVVITRRVAMVIHPEAHRWGWNITGSGCYSDEPMSIARGDREGREKQQQDEEDSRLSLSLSLFPKDRRRHPRRPSSTGWRVFPFRLQCLTVQNYPALGYFFPITPLLHLPFLFPLCFKLLYSNV